MRKIDKLYQLLQESETDNEFISSDEHTNTPFNTDSENEDDDEYVEDDEDDDDDDIVAKKYTIGSKEITCTILYEGEKPGPNNEPKEWQNKLYLFKDDDFNNAIGLDYYGDEELPVLEGLDDIYDTALLTHISYAYMYGLLSKYNDINNEEIKKQTGFEFDFVMNAGKYASEVFAKFGITSEDIETFYKQKIKEQ